MEVNENQDISPVSNDICECVTSQELLLRIPQEGEKHVAI